MRRILQHWKRGWPVRALFSLGGAILGYVYYATIGCDGGCAITGDPWNSTAYGALVGFLAYPGPSGTRNNSDTQDKTSVDQ